MNVGLIWIDDWLERSGKQPGILIEKLFCTAASLTLIDQKAISYHELQDNSKGNHGVELGGSYEFQDC